MKRKAFTLIEGLVIAVIIVCIALTIFGVIGCGRRGPDADQQQAKQTAKAMQEANAQVGMPAIVNFQEKKLAKMLYELRDQSNLICYAYLKSLDGVPVYLGKCIGYGLPYCVQFSNPERVIDLEEQHHTNWAGRGPLSKIPQPEPNGLFMPQTLSATWLMLIDPATNEAKPAYIEPEIIVSPFPLPNAIGGPKVSLATTTATK